MDQMLFIGRIITLRFHYHVLSFWQKKKDSLYLLTDEYSIKFYGAEVSLDKSTTSALRSKMAIFKEVTKTRKQVFLTFLTTFGLKQNTHSLGLVDIALTMVELFAE